VKLIFDFLNYPSNLFFITQQMIMSQLRVIFSWQFVCFQKIVAASVAEFPNVLDVF